MLTQSSSFAVEADYSLSEYERTPPLDETELPERARKVVANDINDTAERLGMDWLPDGRVRLRATQHVGIVSLPEGPTLEIRPKAPDTNILEMLQYAQGIRADTLAEETTISTGQTFITALATLYEAELRTVLERGLLREYQQQSETEQYIRGRLNVQRQLQKHGPQPTRFECTYDDLTEDVLLNQAVLYATDILLRLTNDDQVAGALQRHSQTLRRDVELRPVRAVELEQIELSRLASHYQDLFRLTMLVLQSAYAEDFQTGDRSSYSLLVNMDKIFEAVVERGVREGLDDDLTVEGQASSQKLVRGGSREVTIRPDIVVSGQRGVQVVGDAKWKLDESDSREPSNGDIYQLLSYQLAHDASGVLFYPEQDGAVESVYESDLPGDLGVVEIPTSSGEQDHYDERVENTITDSVTSLIQ